MLSLSLPGRVFLCMLPTDMRKSFDSLAGLVEQQLGQDRWPAICSSSQQARDRLKLLYWDSDGWRSGTSGSKKAPSCSRARRAADQRGAHGLVIRAAELAMLLDGIDLAGAKRRKRYQRPQPAAAAPTS